MPKRPFQYRLPLHLVPDLGVAMIAGQKRSLRAATQQMALRLPPGSAVDGLQHVPRTGPYVLAPNHWQRPGLWIGWPAALLCFAVSRIRADDPPLHFVVTAATPIRWRGREVANPVTAWAFKQVAHVYDMVTMPLHAEESGSRAVAIRSILRLVLPPPTGLGSPLVLFPEGTAGQAGRLGAGQPGVGSLSVRLANIGVPVLPVGIWEASGSLRARIGPPVRYSPAVIRRTDEDLEARLELMRAIARCLPAELRGNHG